MSPAQRIPHELADLLTKILAELHAIRLEILEIRRDMLVKQEDVVQKPKPRFLGQRPIELEMHDDPLG